jgi:parvulin-like peptidyl-prolyl isomerase
MPNTKRSDAGSFVNSTGFGRRPLSSRRFRGLPVLVSLILILILSLAACGGKTGDGGPTAAPVGSPAGAIISTVPATGGPAGQPAGRPATAAPTAAPPTPTLTPTPPAPLAASVNGQYIFLADYERRVAQFEQAMVSQGLDPNSSDGQASLAQIRQQVLDSMIDYALIEQGSAALGVAVSDADLEAQIAADIEAGGGQAAFDQWLQATGQTRDDYKEMLRESLLSQGVMDAIAADVPDAVEQVHARQIVLDSEAAAQEVLTALRQGGDFVALARERSVDVATRDNGGDLGWFPRGLIAPELEAAAFALQPGEISDVIPLGEQYHIVQVVERDATRALSAEQKVDLRFALFDRWLAQQRDGAVIERLVGE